MSEAVEWIGDRDRLRAVAEPWDRLAASEGTPFSRNAWFSCWWDAFGAPRELRVCALWRGNELAAALPLYRDGRRLKGLANVHSPLFRPLADDAAALGVVIGEALDTGLELELFGLPAGDAGTVELTRAAEQRRRTQLVENQHLSPIVETSGSLEDYLGERRSSFREIARRRRKMTREHAASFKLIERPVDLADELERGLRLEQSGWKGERHTAILSDAATARFYRALAHDLDSRGELVFSSLELDGALAAFDLAIRHSGRYWLLKTAYDESWSRLAPGMALRLSVVETCFELGLDAHEFLGEEMEYKRRFSNSERGHVGFRSYPRRLRPALRYAYRARARPLIKRAYLRAARSRRGGTAD